MNREPGIPLRTLTLSGLLASLFFSANALSGGMLPFHDLNHIVEVELDMSQWDELRMQSPRGGICNFEYIGDRYDWFHVERATIDGITFNDIGIKKRSFCGSVSSTKPGLTLKVDKWNAGSIALSMNVFKTESFTFSNSVQDPTLIRQCLGYELFARAGIKSPKCNYAHVVVNGQDMGLYVHIESIKKSFISESFGLPLGNLYEMAFESFADWAIKRIQAHKVGFLPDPWPQDFINVGNAIANDGTPDLSSLTGLVDMDQLLNYWAMEIIMLHWDGFAQASNNTFLYFGADGKLRIIPWGLDQVLVYWGHIEKNGPYHVNNLTDKLYQNPLFREKLFQMVRANLAKIWDEGLIDQRIDEIHDVVRPYVNDPIQQEAGIKALKANIHGRRTEIGKFIPLE